MEPVRTTAPSCIKQPFVLEETEVPPLVGVGVHLAFHSGRRLLLSDTVAGIRWRGEIWHTGEDSPLHPALPAQMAGQQAHHFTSSCQQACCSELCACRQKGPGSCGRTGWFGPSYEYWAGTSSCCRVEDLWFPLMKLALFSLSFCCFSVCFFLVLFNLNLEWRRIMCRAVITQRHSKHTAVEGAVCKNWSYSKRKRGRGNC